MLAEEAERSSRSGWESRGKGHSLTLQLVRVQASMRVAKGLDKGQEQHRCTDREARGNPLLSRRSAAPPSCCWGNLRCCCLPGDSSGAAGVLGLLNGGCAPALRVAAVLGREEEREEEEGGM